jgi:hypothetical protein
MDVHFSASDFSAVLFPWQPRIGIALQKKGDVDAAVMDPIRRDLQNSSYYMTRGYLRLN